MTRGLALYTHTHSIEYTAVSVCVCVCYLYPSIQRHRRARHTQKRVWCDTLNIFKKSNSDFLAMCTLHTYYYYYSNNIYSLSLEVVVIFFFFLFSFISLFSFGCERFWLSCFGCCVHGGLSRGEPQHFWLRGGNKRETHTRAVQVQNRRISEEGRKKEKEKEYI